jgi:hypothetical protein
MKTGSASCPPQQRPGRRRAAWRTWVRGVGCEEGAGGIEEGAPNMREYEINPPPSAQSPQRAGHFALLAFMAVVEGAEAGRGAHASGDNVRVWWGVKLVWVCKCL